MIKKVYFISGLPRSGSTLLSALLNQNPRFYSGPSSPVVKVMETIATTINDLDLFKAFPKVFQVESYIKDFIKYYYSDITQEVIFDKNRVWTGKINDIFYYFKIQPKIICMVRDISEIYMSLKNTKLNKDWNTLLTKDDVLLQDPYNDLKLAYNAYKDCIHIVEYNDLVIKPKETLQDIYKFLNEDYYEHTFNNIQSTYKELDKEVYGDENLHVIRSTLSKSKTRPTQDIIDKCQGMEFWRN